MADIFLSYARSNANQAKRIAAILAELGYSIWFDQDLPAHRPYADVISSELDAATAVLALWSTEAAASQWVRSEADRARETGRLVQARLDDIRLPMPFDQIQCADLRHWSGANTPGWQSVVASLAALASREPPRQAVAAPDRRRVLIAATAAVAVVGGVSGWRALTRLEASPEARLLLQKGLDSLQSNDALETDDPGSTLQAIALLTDATRADPRSATAWGALALAYAVRRRASALADRGGLESRARSSASNAFELEAQEPRALAALRLLDPLYRNWLGAELADRDALRFHPKFPILLFILSEMLGSVGRWREAAYLSGQMDRANYLIPGADRKIIINLWSSGDLQGADDAVRVAAEHWPQHPQVWRTQVDYFLYSGRPSEALAILRDESRLPPAISLGLVDAARATGEALANRRDAADAVRINLDYLNANPAAALQTSQALAALGKLGAALDVLSGYYFGEGEWARLAPPGGDLDRLTGPLFQPPMIRLWGDSRFKRLVQRIGLDAYWRQSGSVPDHRRTT